MSGTTLLNSPTGRAPTPAVVVAVRLDLATRERAAERAVNERVSLSKLIKTALTAYLDAAPAAAEARAE